MFDFYPNKYFSYSQQNQPLFFFWPSDCENKVIRMASRNGHLENVKLLSQGSRVDPADYDNYSTEGYRQMDI